MEALNARGPKRGLLGFPVGVWAVFWGLSRLLADRDLRRLTLVPLGLTAVMYSLALAGLGLYGHNLLGLLWRQPDATVLLILWWVVAALVIAGAFLILVLLFGTVAEAVGGPFYDRMAMRVLQSHGVPTQEPSFWDGTVSDLVRSLIFPLLALLLGLLALMPGVGLPFLVGATLVTWLGFASGAVNPSLLVTGYSMRQRLGWLRQYRFTSLGLGCVVAFAMLVPLLGLIALPASIVGATELHGRALRRETTE